MVTVSVSPHFAPTASCKRPCSNPVDTQHLSLLRCFLHGLSSSSGYLKSNGWRLRKFPAIDCQALIGYELLSLLVQRDSGIYRLLPDFYGGNKLYTIPKHFPLSFNCYCIISSPYNTSNAYKKFDPTGGFRIFVCELSCWVIWVEYLCFSFPMYLLLWANHQHVINIHLHVEKLSVRDIPYSFFFPNAYATVTV